MHLLRVRGALAAATAVSVLALTACSGSGDDGSSDPAGSSATGAAEDAPASSTEPASDEPFGEGCPAVSADDPVVTAAGGVPELSGLVESLTRANLVDSFNSTEDITVLAPVDAAFEAVPEDDLRALLRDNARLTALLTHHVIEGRLAPGQLAGEQTTLNGDTVTIEGSGEDFTVPAGGTVLGESAATVICGNLQTANATVYLVDQVLAPPES